MSKSTTIYLLESSNKIYPAHITFSESQSKEVKNTFKSIAHIIDYCDNVILTNLIINFNNKKGKFLKCNLDINYNNEYFTLLLDLHEDNLLLLMEYCNMKSGGIFNENEFVFTFSRYGLCIVPKVDNCIEYQEFLKEKNKTELVSKSVKISKNNIKPFTFYKDIDGNVYAVIGLFSRYIPKSSRKNKVLRDVFVLRNFFEGNFISNLTEINLENVIPLSKIDFYEELECFSNLDLESFLNFYNNNFSISNLNCLESYFKDDDYYFFNSLVYVMNNQSFISFLKNNCKLINESNAVLKYFNNLSTSFKKDLKDLFFIHQDTEIFYNKYLKFASSKLDVKDFYRDDKIQFYNAQYNLMLLFENLRNYETANTLYLKSKDVKENCFESKKLNFDDILTNLVSILNRTVYGFSLYKAKSSYGSEYLSNTKIYFLHKKSNSFVFDYSTTYQGSYTNILPYKEFTISNLIDVLNNDETFYMLLECFRSSSSR